MKRLDRILSVVAASVLLTTSASFMQTTYAEEANISESVLTTEVDSWYELRDALQSDEYMEVIVPKGIHIQHEYIAASEDSTDFVVNWSNVNKVDRKKLRTK